MGEKEAAQQVTCPHCGYEITIDVNFCPRCEKKLRLVEYCPKCGAKPKKGEKKCAYCGEDLFKLGVTTKAQPELKRPMGIVILCVLWVWGGLWYVYHGASWIWRDWGYFMEGAHLWGGAYYLALLLDVILAGVLLVIGVLMFVTIYGFWNGKRWAYNAGIVIPILVMIIVILVEVNWIVYVIRDFGMEYYMEMVRDLDYWIDYLPRVVFGVVVFIISIVILLQDNVKKWLSR